ncbi:hypothetical protein CP061683_1653, partial [Chlamydia psittaci 06-1683]
IFFAEITQLTENHAFSLKNLPCNLKITHYLYENHTFNANIRHFLFENPRFN